MGRGRPGFGFMVELVRGIPPTPSAARLTPSRRRPCPCIQWSSWFAGSAYAFGLSLNDGAWATGFWFHVRVGSRDPAYAFGCSFNAKPKATVSLYSMVEWVRGSAYAFGLSLNDGAWATVFWFHGRVGSRDPAYAFGLSLNDGAWATVSLCSMVEWVRGIRLRLRLVVKRAHIESDYRLVARLVRVS